MRFGATECCSTSFLLPPPVVPPCSTPYSFFSCFTSPHVEIPRAWAGPNDEPAASFGLILFRPVDPSPSPPCHAFFPIPFDTVNICANFAPSSRDSLPPSIFMPNILSQSTLFSFRPVSFDFSVLLLHTISLILHHLALYHFQVAISESESFESSPTSKTQPSICPSILSEL
jgi:hypothetical protein